jgi:hypothetical protein
MPLERALRRMEVLLRRERLARSRRRAVRAVPPVRRKQV